MDEDNKVNFIKPMLVLKIREAYKAPYHKNKYISIKPKDVVDKRTFVKLLQNYTKNWSSGVYELQYLFSQGFMYDSNVYSTFVRFDVRDGKLVKVWKNSPYSRKEYPIWSYFKKVKRKKTVKKKTTKKTSKKPIKKTTKKKTVKKVKKKIAKKKPIKKKVIKKKTIKRKIVKKTRKPARKTVKKKTSRKKRK